MADGTEGLTVIDVSDPSLPEEIDNFQTGDYAWGVFVMDTLVFVSDGSTGMYIIRFGGSGTSEPEPEPEPEPEDLQYLEKSGIHLFGNYPNPFNERTAIRYELLQPARVEVSIYDAMGQKIGDLFRGYQVKGKYTLEWIADDRSMKPGVYFYRITVNGYTCSGKALLSE
jgi:hypothetical protein